MLITQGTACLTLNTYFTVCEAFHTSAAQLGDGKKQDHVLHFAGSAMWISSH